jgi:UTP--glucose-1-phosphate uridylyltransferase
MSEKKKVRKAVVAAAGFGTRFLPQTKAMPKEMLPLVDKPIIQHIVEELVDAGIEDIIIVTGYHKRSIEDHFDYVSADLRANLKRNGKTDLLEEVKRISDLANFVYIRQKGPNGNATPLINSEHLISGEPFIYAWADDFVKATPSRFKQLLDVYERRGGNVFTCIRTEKDEDYDKYGYVSGSQVEPGLTLIEQILEKPGKEKAPSNIASVGGYVYEADIFPYLARRLSELQPDQEFVMQEVVQKMVEDGHKFYACEVKDGKFYDTGNKLEYIKTVVDFALEHEDIKDELKVYLRGLDI